MKNVCKVVQWTSGGVAKAAVKGILSHPDLELVGMFAFSPEKVGKDIGDLAGLEPLGIAATDDIQALVDLQPDVVSYNPLYPNVDHLVQLLEAGINIVTTCNFLTGFHLDYCVDRYGPNARQRVQEAAVKGGASIFGTGMNPGHVNYQGCVMASVCESFAHLRVTEVVDNMVPFLGDDNVQVMGFGQPLDSSELYAVQKAECSVFGDAIEMMAQVLGIELDDVRFQVEYAPAARDFDIPGGQIKKGTIGGMRLRWEGLVNGEPVLENQQIWLCGENTEDADKWRNPGQHGYLVDIQGSPNVYNMMLPIPAVDFSAMTKEAVQALGMSITAMPAVNAFPAVCAAPPGIVTYKHLATVSAAGRYQRGPAD
ncbi:MAG: dihydrodipicolinate reductase [Halioglobus sp.]